MRLTFEIARARNARRESAIVRAKDDRGNLGFGEATPLPAYSSDTFDRAWVALRDLPPLELASVDFNALASITLRSAAAQFAFETAALDCMARRLGVPMRRLLGGDEDAGSRPLAAMLPNPEEAEATQRIREGFTTLKLKVGAPGRFTRELALLAGLAEKRAVRIRLDANRRLTTESAALFGAFPIELFEEPCALDALSRRVFPARGPNPRSSVFHARGPNPRTWLPLALDETLQDAAFDLPTFLAATPVRALVLKPATLGGFSRCMALARVAKEHGISAVVSHSMDGPIAFAAAAEFALAIDTDLAVGLAPHSLLDARDVPQLRGPMLVATDRPGHGVSWIS